MDQYPFLNFFFFLNSSDVRKERKAAVAKTNTGPPVTRSNRFNHLEEGEVAGMIDTSTENM